MPVLELQSGSATRIPSGRIIPSKCLPFSLPAALQYIAQFGFKTGLSQRDQSICTERYCLYSRYKMPPLLRTPSLPAAWLCLLNMLISSPSSLVLCISLEKWAAQYCFGSSGMERKGCYLGHHFTGSSFPRSNQQQPFSCLIFKQSNSELKASCRNSESFMGSVRFHWHNDKSRKSLYGRE